MAGLAQNERGRNTDTSRTLKRRAMLGLVY